MPDTIRMDQIAPASGALSSAIPNISPAALSPTLQQTSKIQKPGDSGPATGANLNSGRKDMESLYFALKAALSDKWSDYKSAMSQFMLGRMNQQELYHKIGSFITSDPATLHYHNQFICAICYNTTRDPPEVSVAAWVSANEKPSLGPKLTASDEFEQRLRAEVMQIPARDRHRIKSINDEPYDSLVETFASQRATREIHVPEMGAVGSSNKTNWEPEIRKRYTQALAVEANDLPDVDLLNSRITPICYEEGLSGGCTPSCSEFLNVALRTFLKGALGHLFQRTRCNGANFVKTARFSRRLDKEDELSARDEVRRNADGFLPVEVEAIAKRKPISLYDLKMSIRFGDPYFGQIPLLCRRLLEMGAVTEEGDSNILVATSTGLGVLNPISKNQASLKTGGRAISNGAAHSFLKKQHLHNSLHNGPPSSFGVTGMEGQKSPSFAITRAAALLDGDVEMTDTHEDDDEMEIGDEDDEMEGPEWQGAGAEDIFTLNNLLDECIAV